MQQKGYEIIDRNYSCRYGEIDIIGKESNYLVFLEVKYRSNARMGYPEEAVNVYKIRHILQASQWYMYEKGYSLDTPVRYDVVAMGRDQIRLIKNAFEAG